MTRLRERGFTLAELIHSIALGAVFAALALPNLIQARKHGNEASAIGALNAVTTAETIFRECDREQDGDLDYGMLSELDATRLVDSELGSGAKRGYVFAASYSFTTSEFLWFGAANPERPGSTGDRSYVTNQAGVIFYSTTSCLALDTNTCSLPNDRVVPGYR